MTRPLHELIKTSFDSEELSQLCFLLGVDDEKFYTRSSHAHVRTAQPTMFSIMLSASGGTIPSPKGRSYEFTAISY
jgi:hypothetical protein